MIGITKGKLINFSVLMYFLFLMLSNQIDNYIVFVGFYVALLLCGIIGLYTYNFRVKKNRIIIILLLILTAITNMTVIGNTTHNDVVFMTLYAFAAFALTSDELDENTLLLAFGMNVAVILYKFATVGVITGQLFLTSSRNFVSVYLMYPLVVYYSILARKNKEINMIPLLIAWIMCLIARGRGGIISSTFFIVAIYAVKYKSMRSFRRILTAGVIVVGVAAVVLNLSTILRSLGASAIMEMFARNGLQSSRIRFWPEYINLAKSNLKYFIFGADISKTIIGQALGGNPHNSFIEIHMLNGIIGLGLVVYTSVKNCVKSVKEKQYVFLVCMLAMFIRAFTDHVLWAAYGTPVLFFFMFYYDSYAAYRPIAQEEMQLEICREGSSFGR